MPKILRFSPPQKYGIAPYSGMQKIMAHIVAGLMLFPERQDEKTFVPISASVLILPSVRP